MTVIDRRNHHLFQPLLYQVATTALARPKSPGRSAICCAARREVTTLLGNVTGIDTAQRVRLDDGGAVPYDTLILATGARHAYFGHDDWEPFAPGLKTLEDATDDPPPHALAFERAETARPIRRSARRC